MIKIVNNTVPSALIKLGYNEAEVNAIVSYIDATGTIEGAPGVSPSISPSSTAPSSPPKAPAASTTSATSR